MEGGDMILRSAGKKMALVVGCNYSGTDYALNGCHEDALGIRRTLSVRFGFDSSSIKVMLDTPGNREMPTAAKIKSELYSMISRTKSGDVLFFYFSGHGTDFTRPRDPRIDFRDMVNRVPKGASFTIMADSCSSGGLIDKEPVQISPHMILEEDEDLDNDDDVETGTGTPRKMPFETLLQRMSSRTGLNNGDIGVHMVHLFGSDASLLFTLSPDHLPKPLKPDQGILLSGCQPDENCSETKNGSGGLFTTTFQKIVYKNRANLTNAKIILMARKLLERHNNVSKPDSQQHPCLYCSDKNASAIFLVHAGRLP